MDRDLRNRWSSPEWSDRREKVLSALLDRTSLSNVPEMEKYRDKWDLRGFPFPADKSIRGIVLSDVDLSFAVLNDSVWERCTFNKVIFDSVEAGYSKFLACGFESAFFLKSQLGHTLMNGTVGDDTGYFRNSVFADSNLKFTIHANALFEKCRFEWCKLDQVDFNGARFSDCTFIGKLLEVVFRGRQLINRKLYPNANPKPNTMNNVNFTEADFECVDLLDEIDLSSCKLPVSSELVIILENKNQVFERAREIIASNWNEKSRALGLAVIDRGYLSPRAKSAKSAVVDRNCLAQSQIGDSFFELIKRCKDEV